jgi:coronin-1B/1C/6
MRISTVTGEQQYIKASSKYFAVALAGGGGPLCVGRLDRPGRFEAGTSQVVEGHTGSILDIDFNPFDDSMFATASEDSTIKVWSIPDDWEPTDENGMAKQGNNLTESLIDLVGHQKRVTLLQYHPTASNILLSTSADTTVKTWDIEKGEAITSFDDTPDLIQDIVWDFRGDAYASSCKDNAVRIFDARTASISSKIDPAHEGPKSTKITFLGDSGKMLTCGFSKQSAREIKVWDLKHLSKPLCTETIDNAAGAIIPLYDNDTKVLYLCGKGDGQIRIYEFEDKEPFIHKLNDGYRSTQPTKGICMVPKRGLNVMNHETARLLKLTNNQGIQPLSFCVPRKSDAFQDDIFPDCVAPIPAHSGDQWLAGSSKDPVTMSLNPALANSELTKKKVFKTVSQLSKELDEANQRIEFLENKLKENGIAYDE